MIIPCQTFALLRLWLLIDEQSEYAKNGRSKLQGRCELSGGQLRLASFVYLVYCPSARLGEKFQLVMTAASTGKLHTSSGE